MQQFLEAYIKKVEDIDLIDDYIHKAYGEETIYKVSLITGYPGIAMTLFSIYQHTKNFKYYKLANKYLEKTIDLISSVPIYSTSLFEGAFGVIFSLLICSDSGNNYSDIIKSLLLEYKKIASDEIRDLKKNIKEGKVESQDYDIVSGCAGTLSVLLLATDIYPSLYDDLYIEISELSNILEKLVDEYNEIDNEQNTLFCDLGYAHGMPGVINILCNSYKRGYKTSKTKDILISSISKLNKSLKINNGTIYMPTDTNNTNNFRDAWCYGIPSIAYTIYNIAKTFQISNMLELSQNLLYQTWLRKEYETKLISPTLCHGFSGIVIISLIMNNEDLANKYIDKINNTDVDDKDLLFFDINSNSSLTKDIGLLNGNSGILLTMLSFNNRDIQLNHWSKFLIF
ncbi:lanthionine synthetase C family protein [Staphylococcus hominis]|uniref:lanthionine synthetase C family protein n=1 Tax=Staphylococcus hominis TaxID=1290 RepID=UPI00098B11D7|nr:lanthionine synthetase C family protein [Staphylococcus hominis]MBJ6365070.1 lanthionine synthetase C family protein [Staphylococcus hominis]MDS3837914.1 lanthionine synthetase C family protein [Staphylococcus hominis]